MLRGGQALTHTGNRHLTLTACASRRYTASDIHNVLPLQSFIQVKKKSLAFILITSSPSFSQLKQINKSLSRH